MANRRSLKKDIDYLVYEVVSDCFTVMSVKESGMGEELAEVISDAVVLRNELIARVNHPDGRDNPGITKQYYNKIRKDLIESIDKLFERVSEIAKK